MRIGKLTYLVRDYDEAIAWFTRCLGFELAEDVDLGEPKRWVVVRAPGQSGGALLLARAVGAEQNAAVGRQAGGRVFLFLETQDFDRDHTRMLAEGVAFREAPRTEPYGMVAVFEDLYGNPWDLIEARG
ncbi:MAG: VOC family protein [Hyphomonadaceae bacterium]